MNIATPEYPLGIAPARIAERAEARRSPVFLNTDSNKVHAPCRRSRGDGNLRHPPPA